MTVSLRAAAAPAGRSPSHYRSPSLDASVCKDSCAAIRDELESLPLPPPLSPIPSSSRSLSPAGTTGEPHDSSASHVTSGRSISSAASPPKSLLEQLREVLGSSDSDSESESGTGSTIGVTSALASVGLLEDSDDDDTSLRSKRSRLRRGDENSSWHPTLPKPPEKHPVTHHRNHYDPDASWDYGAVAPIKRLLDARGEPPHRCYLVQWKGGPLQMSWVWMEDLDNASMRGLMEEVDRRQAKGNTDPYFSVQRDSASASGKCFMDALRSTLYYLGAPNLVTLEMWDAFEATRPSEIQDGVTRDDVTEFFKLLQRQSAPLNYDRLMVNLQSSSCATIKTLHDFCKTLDAGAYIVSADEDGLGRCFVMISHGPGKRLISLDDYDPEHDPPMVVMPLRYQAWVKNVKWICRVELQPGYQCRHGKRKSKTQRKREKRLKAQQQKQ